VKKFLWFDKLRVGMAHSTPGLGYFSSKPSKKRPTV
jgi:hypothetical protein